MGVTGLIAAAAALVTIGFAPVPAAADQIYVQQTGSSPAGGDPNYITNMGAVTVGVAGSAALQNPLLIIVGVYNGDGTPSIAFGGCGTAPCPEATLGTYGLTSVTGTLNNSSPATATAYSLLGLSAGGSQNPPNWFGAWSSGDVADNLPAPTSFTLYAFALNTSLTSGSPITIGVSGAADGSYIIGYSCEAGTGSSTGCAKQGDVAQTPYTNSGLYDTPIPEPASLALFGFGLLFLGALRRRKPASPVL